MRTTTVVFLLWAGLPLIGRAQSSLPTITRFAASPAKVLPGQPSTLSWSVIGATSLIMGSGSGAGAVAGTPVDGTSVIVTPATTTSYTKEARTLYNAADVQPGVQESDAQIERLAGKQLRSNW